VSFVVGTRSQRTSTVEFMENMVQISRHVRDRICNNGDEIAFVGRSKVKENESVHEFTFKY
jgi:hypothetical protein